MNHLTEFIVKNLDTEKLFAFIEKNHKMMSISQITFLIHKFLKNENYKIKFQVETKLYDSISQIEKIDIKNLYYNQYNYYIFNIHINIKKFISIQEVIPESYLQILHIQQKEFDDSIFDFLNIFNNRILSKITKLHLKNNLEMSEFINKIEKKDNYSIKGITSLGGIINIEKSVENIRIQNLLKVVNIFWNKKRTEYGLKTLLENLTQKKINIISQQEYVENIDENILPKLKTNFILGQSFIGNKFRMKNGINIEISLNSKDFLKFLPQEYISSNSKYKTHYIELKNIIKTYLGITKKFKISFKIIDKSIADNQIKLSQTKLGVDSLINFKKSHSYIINIIDKDFY